MTERSPGHRFYSDSSIYELEDRVRQHELDPWALLTILEELRNRKTSRAGKLRVELERMLSPQIHENGLLRYLGYGIDANRADQYERRKILDMAYNSRLPVLTPAEFDAHWGRPQSETRLRRIAEDLAAMLGARKRSTRPDLQTTPQEMADDIEFLRQHHYKARYSFPWPTSQD